MLEQGNWVDVQPAILQANNMCGGCWLGDPDCGDAKKPYALSPFNGQATGRYDDEGPRISKDKARISVAWCLEQMKDYSECSKRFGIVDENNGRCWCVKAGGECNADKSDSIFAKSIHLFELSNEDPECTAGSFVNITALEDPYKTVTFSKGNKYGSEATFGCNDGFVLDGPPSITCEAARLNDIWPTAASCIGLLLIWPQNQPFAYSFITLQYFSCNGCKPLLLAHAPTSLTCRAYAGTISLLRRCFVWGEFNALCQ